jgi:hypothetical protein
MLEISEIIIRESRAGYGTVAKNKRKSKKEAKTRNFVSSQK